MATLSPTNTNTVELGGTLWRAIYNANFTTINTYFEYIQEMWDSPTGDGNIVRFNADSATDQFEMKELDIGFIWTVVGTLSTGTEQGGVWIAPCTQEIIYAYIYCKTTGTVSGATTVDINKNGTTIFTTQANRPSLAYNDGDKKDVSGVPDVTTLTEGDIISIDIDAIPGGADSADLSLILICR